MQPLTRKFVGVGIACLAGGAGYLVYKGTVKVLRQDPISAFREKNPDELPREVGIQALDTEFKHIEKGKPSASCFVKQMRIANNRQIYDLVGIKDGKLTWKNVTYRFEANQGNWNGFSRTLSLSKKTRLKGPNFDLASEQVGYNEKTRTLEVPQAVTGTAYGGKLTVANFVYNMDEETFEAGRGSWQGKLPKEVKQESPDVKKDRVWDFDFANVKKVKDNKDLVSYIDAKATDGEVILIAKLITHNQKTDVVTATGNVRYFGSSANVIADKIEVYRKEKKTVLTGNVTMLVKPKSQSEEKAKEEVLTPMLPVVPDSISMTRPPAPDTDEARKKREEIIRSGKNIREYPLVITATKIDYWYKKGERRAVITGKPQARQELPENGWRYIWADSAKYDGEKEILTLESGKSGQDVILKNSLGDELYVEWGQLSTKEGEDDYEFKKGRAKMSTRDNDEDIPPAKDGKGTTNGGGTTGGGGITGPIGRT